MSNIKKKDLGKRPPVVIANYKPKFKARPHIDDLLDDAFQILGNELRRMRQKTDRGESLDAKEASKAVKYAEVATKLMREEREQEKHADPGKLSDEELLQAVKEAEKLLSEGQKNE